MQPFAPRPTESQGAADECYPLRVKQLSRCPMFAIAIFAVACGRGRAHDAWVTACHAREHVPADAPNVEAVRWVHANVTEPSVVDEFRSVATSTGPDKFA